MCMHYKLCIVYVLYVSIYNILYMNISTIYIEMVINNTTTNNELSIIHSPMRMIHL